MTEEEAKNRLKRPENQEALMLWHKVTLNSVQRDSFDLSARQMSLLLTVALDEGPHTVRGLSEHLCISKPAICRALDTLSKYKLTKRIVDQNDRRNVFIVPTDSGYSFLADFSDSILDNLSL